MIFGMMTRIGPLTAEMPLKFRILKILDGGSRHVENHKKTQYIRNGLTDRSFEIWYAGAKRGLLTALTAKKFEFHKDGGRPPF